MYLTTAFIPLGNCIVFCSFPKETFLSKITPIIFSIYYYMNISKRGTYINMVDRIDFPQIEVNINIFVRWFRAKLLRYIQNKKEADFSYYEKLVKDL